MSGCEDLSGLASGGPATTEDAGATTQDAGAGDAASAPDAGEARGWCETEPFHYFCDDFDTARPWTREHIFGGGALGMTTEAVSAPTALAVTLPPGASNSDSGAFRVRAVPVTAKRVTVSADVRPCTLSSGTTFFVILQTLSQNARTANAALGERFESGAAPVSVLHFNDFADGALGKGNVPGSPLPRDTWSRVTLVVDLSETAGSIKGARDGEELGGLTTPTQWPSRRAARCGSARCGSAPKRVTSAWTT